MDYNLENDYQQLETNQDSSNFKINKQKKLSIFIIFLIFSICFIYRGIRSSNSNIITITSKDGTQKMSLMNKDIKYRGPNSCPRGYHIPTAYERRKLGKLRCENHPTCDANGYIGYTSDDVGIIFNRLGDTDREFIFSTEKYVSDYYEIQKFFHDFNIHLDKHFNFGAGFLATKDLGINNHNSYCDALDAYDSLNGFVNFSVDYYSLVDCNEPKHVRCFSDENITSESTNEESLTSDFGFERTKFEIDGISYSGRKVTKMPRGDVVIPDSFVGISIIEVGGGLYGGITSVKLGENIIKIDDHAFASNGIGIKEIEFPDSVLYIGDYAFLNNQLSSIKFSNNLLYIGENAFNNNKLTSIKLPDTVKFIGVGAFSNNEITSNDLLGHPSEK